MTPSQAEALMFAGITPPTSGTKTTCPHCSHERSKPQERCLKVFPHPGRVDCGRSRSWLGLLGSAK